MFNAYGVSLHLAAVGVAQTDAVVAFLLDNVTPATAGNQKYSPILCLEGQGKAGTIGASKECQYALQVVPTSATQGVLQVLSSYNDLGFAAVGPIMQISHNGTVWTRLGTFFGDGVTDPGGTAGYVTFTSIVGNGDGAYATVQAPALGTGTGPTYPQRWGYGPAEAGPETFSCGWFKLYSNVAGGGRVLAWVE